MENIRLAFVTALQLPPASAPCELREVFAGGDRGRRVARHVGVAVKAPPNWPGHPRRPATATDASHPSGGDEQRASRRYLDASSATTSCTLALCGTRHQCRFPYDLATGPGRDGAWVLGEGRGCRGSRLVRPANGGVAFGPTGRRARLDQAVRHPTPEVSVTASSATTTSSTPTSSPRSAPLQPPGVGRHAVTSPTLRVE